MSLNLGIIDTWGQIILCCEVGPVHCRMFSCIPGLYLLDASNTFLPQPLSCDNQKCLQTLPNVPGRLWAERVARKIDPLKEAIKNFLGDLNTGSFFKKWNKLIGNLTLYTLILLTSLPYWAPTMWKHFVKVGHTERFKACPLFLRPLEYSWRYAPTHSYQ